MTVAGTDDLLLAALATDECDAGARPLSALVDAFGASTGRLSGQIELVTALEDLQAAGLVERSAATASAGETTFALTDAGEQRADTVRRELGETRIDLVAEGRRRELPLAEAAAELDRSLVSIATALSEDGVYYRDDEPGVDRVVGRDEERRRCQTALERTREERSGRAVLLVGPGGIGKTTLVSDVVETAREEGFTVARADGRSAADSFEPVREWLRGLEIETNPFADAGPSVDDPETFRTQQTGLFHDLTGALAPADDEPARVLALDDLHLVDAATLSYLAYLLERLSELPIVLVATYRSAALPDDAPVAADAVPEDADVTRLPLEPLDRDGTRGIVERVVGRRGAPATFVEAIHERTGGNPLFVEETVARLLESGQLDRNFEWYPDEPDAIDVPDAVTETIERRVGALDDDARELLRWAAVIGERVPLAVLERVCEVSTERLETLLAALAAGDVFAWTEDREEVTFRSQVVRDALYDDHGEDVRRERHDAVAAALEDLADAEEDAGTGERAAAIAAHHERAGNAERAVAWYRRAGERATDVYAHDAAIDHYHGALALARDGGDGDGVLDLTRRLAEIYLVTGDFDRARRHVDFVAERADDPRRRRQTALLTSRILSCRGDYEAAIERAADGLALEGDPSETTCRILYEKAKAHRERGEYERAADAARRQRDVAADLGDPILEARAIQQLGSIDSTRGEYDSATERLRTAYETFEANDARRDAAKARMTLGIVARSQGRLEAAREHYRRALEDHRTVGTRNAVAAVRVNLGVVAASLGEYEEATEHYRQALAELEAIGDRHTAAICRHNLGKVAVDTSDHERAREHLRESHETLAEIGDRRLVARSYLYRGELALREGRFDDAESTLEAAREEAADIGNRRTTATAEMLLGARALDLGAYDCAREHLEAAREAFEELDDRRHVASTRRYLGDLALEREEYERARELLEDAREAFRAAEDRQGVAAAHLSQGRLALEREEYERASEYLEDAREVFADTGARHLEAQTRRFLGELALERGATERAREHLGDALETATELGARHDVARSRAALGEVALRAGELESGFDRLESALETFEEIGATSDALETLELLVECRIERGADDVRELLERAERLLEDCEEPLEIHRERISELRASFEDQSEESGD